jgi:hypothetical protein
MGLWSLVDEKGSKPAEHLSVTRTWGPRTCEMASTSGWSSRGGGAAKVRGSLLEEVQVKQPIRMLSIATYGRFRYSAAVTSTIYNSQMLQTKAHQFKFRRIFSYISTGMGGGGGDPGQDLLLRKVLLRVAVTTFEQWELKVGANKWGYQSLKMQPTTFYFILF